MTAQSLRIAHPHRPAPLGTPSVPRDQGVAIVEMALVVPLLMMILMGIISAGTTYNRQLSLSHAAREGARYGAILSPDQNFDSGTWASNAKNMIIARSGGELTATTGTICVSLVEGSTASTYVGTHANTWFSTNADGSPCDAADSYTTTTNDDGLRVQVIVTKPAKWEMGLFSRTITLRSSVVLQSEFAS